MEEKKFTNEEEIQLAKEYREFSDRSQRYSMDRYNKIADAIREIELQIAGFVFAFSIAFITEKLLKAPIFLLIIYCISLGLLFLSVCLGLFGEHVKSKFWEDDVKRFMSVLGMYDKVVRQTDTSLMDAINYERGVFGGVGWRTSDRLPFILQTSSLLVGFGGILLSIVISLFSRIG